MAAVTIELREKSRTAASPTRLGARIIGGGVRSAPSAGHMHETCDAGLLRRPRHRARAEAVHRLEILAAGIGENADEIDDRLANPQRPGDGGRMRRLAWTAWIWPTRPEGCRWKARSGRRVATRMRQPRSGKLAHNLPADEARTAEHRDDVGPSGSVLLPFCPRAGAERHLVQFRAAGK